MRCGWPIAAMSCRRGGSCSAAGGVSFWPIPRSGPPISKEVGTVPAFMLQLIRTPYWGGLMKYLVRSVILAAAFALSAGAAKAQNIPIAVVGPITGSNAALGEQMKRGAEMAVADINAKGGVLGKKLDLTIADDACDPKQAG